jgi:hypothetical protein
MNSLDLKANEFIVHIRSDAQIDKLAVVKALNSLDQVQNFSVNYP